MDILIIKCSNVINILKYYFPNDIIKLIIINYHELNKKIKISCGSNFTILSYNEYLYGRGDNTRGQLGIEGVTHSSIFILLKKFEYIINKIACGKNHTIISLENRDVYGWGQNKYGQLGKDPSMDPNRASLGKDFGELSAGNAYNFIKGIGFKIGKLNIDNPTQIFCGNNHSGYKSDYFYLFGKNDKNQLKIYDPFTKNDIKPIQLAIGSIFDAIISIDLLQKINTQNIKKIKTSQDYCAALTIFNTLNVWGNYPGCKEQYRQTSLRIENVKKFSCGYDHIMISTFTNEIYIYDKYKLVLLNINGAKIRKIIASGGISYIINIKNDVFVWKNNPSDVFLNTISRNKIYKIKNLSNIKTIICGMNHTFAITYNNEIFERGSNDEFNRVSFDKIDLSFLNRKYQNPYRIKYYS